MVQLHKKLYHFNLYNKGKDVIMSSHNFRALFIIVLLLIPVFLASPVSGNSGDVKTMAESFGISGNYEIDDGDLIPIPVNINNVDNGPIQTIVFNVAYDERFVSLEKLEINSLTSAWIHSLGTNSHSVTLSTFDQKEALANASSGAVCTLYFKVTDHRFKSTIISIENVDFASIHNIHGMPATSIGKVVFEGDPTLENSMSTGIDTEFSSQEKENGSAEYEELENSGHNASGSECNPSEYVNLSFDSKKESNEKAGDEVEFASTNNKSSKNIPSISFIGNVFLLIMGAMLMKKI